MDSSAAVTETRLLDDCPYCGCSWNIGSGGVEYCLCDEVDPGSATLIFRDEELPLNQNATPIPSRVDIDAAVEDGGNSLDLMDFHSIY
tara:strand:+ start:633 stop:896 length:264 start_codon:yes stop_codon:yes gene_type:complete